MHVAEGSVSEPALAHSISVFGGCAMKTSRISAAVVATLALCAAGSAHADPTAAGATGGTTAVLSPYLKVWVNGDTLGPNRLGQKTGAGTMDAAFTWDATAFA